MGSDDGKPDLISVEGVLEFLNSITQDPAKVQLGVLTSILKQNANCEYLTRLGLDGSTDVESFRSRVPLSDYDTIKPDLDRIADGESSEETPILCTDRIVELMTSSGTSGGQRKFFPKGEGEGTRLALFSAITNAVVTTSFPDLANGRILHLLCLRPGEKTRGGVLAQTTTASLAKANFLEGGPFTGITASPWQVFLTPEKDDQMLYCHWICGLVHSKAIVEITAILASGFVRAVLYLQTWWQQICLDIRQGKLRDTIDDPDVRVAVEDVMGGPNQELADRIESICSHRSNWDGIVKELFPNLFLLDAIATGSMAAYVPLMRSYVGEVHIMSLVYAASEGFLGINLRPACALEDVAYTLIPALAYYEFLPVNNPEQAVGDGSPPDTSQLVDLASVKLGHVYELVLTTSNGLYRYRMEDCLKVARFYNNTPEFQFVERRNVVLSVDTDKSTESDLFGAVTAAGSLLEAQTNTRILDYTTYADVSSTPGYYVFYLELTNQEALQDMGPVLEDCCAKMENSLNYIYRRNRNEGHIGPLTLKVVEKGSFNLIRDAAIERGTSMNQYKTSRCLKLPSDLKLLKARTVKEVRSSGLPEFCPE